MQLTEQIKKHINGATFIGIDTLTKPELLGGKKNPHKDRITKLMEGANCMIFQNLEKNGYAEKVKRHLIKEGKDPESFQLSPRVWGTRIPGTPFVEHNGKMYLELIFLTPGRVTYLLDGKVIDKSEIIGLKPHQEGEQGGLENKVIIRTVSVDNILKVRIDNNFFINTTVTN